jgi:hypothetical protein
MQLSTPPHGLPFRAACAARASVLGCAVLVVVATAVGCTRRGGAPIDGGAAGLDALAIDAPIAPIDVGAPVADAGDGDGDDAGGRCRDHFDCAIGRACVGGACVGPADDCCHGAGCPGELSCSPVTCACVETTADCCTFPERCGDGFECLPDCSCSALCDPPCTGDAYCDDGSCISLDCDPACPTDWICMFRVCYPSCDFEGCPDGETCTREGCVRRCSGGACDAGADGRGDAGRGDAGRGGDGSGDAGADPARGTPARCGPSGASPRG